MKSETKELIRRIISCDLSILNDAQGIVDDSFFEDIYDFNEDDNDLVVNVIDVYNAHQLYKEKKLTSYGYVFWHITSMTIAFMNIHFDETKGLILSEIFGDDKMNEALHAFYEEEQVSFESFDVIAEEIAQVDEKFFDRTIESLIGEERIGEPLDIARFYFLLWRTNKFDHEKAIEAVSNAFTMSSSDDRLKLCKMISESSDDFFIDKNNFFEMIKSNAIESPITYGEAYIEWLYHDLSKKGFRDWKAINDYLNGYVKDLPKDAYFLEKKALLFYNGLVVPKDEEKAFEEFESAYSISTNDKRNCNLESYAESAYYFALLGEKYGVEREARILALLRAKSILTFDKDDLAFGPAPELYNKVEKFLQSFSNAEINDTKKGQYTSVIDVLEHKHSVGKYFAITYDYVFAVYRLEEVDLTEGAEIPTFKLEKASFNVFDSDEDAPEYLAINYLNMPTQVTAFEDVLLKSVKLKGDGYQYANNLEEACMHLSDIVFKKDKIFVIQDIFNVEINSVTDLSKTEVYFSCKYKKEDGKKKESLLVRHFVLTNINFISVKEIENEEFEMHEFDLEGAGQIVSYATIEGMLVMKLKYENQIFEIHCAGVQFKEELF